MYTSHLRPYIGDSGTDGWLRFTVSPGLGMIPVSMGGYGLQGVQDWEFLYGWVQTSTIVCSSGTVSILKQLFHNEK